MAVFLRFGYRKVTMDDIARGVGISRPALYLLFPNKEAVFRDVVSAGLDGLLEDIERGLPSRTSLRDQLLHVFEVSSVRTFELVRRAPASSELMNATFDFAKDLFDGYDRKLAALVSRLLRAAVSRPAALQPSAQARARVMLAAAQGFKATAKDTRDMKALVDDLVTIVVDGLVVGGRARRKPA